MLVVEGGLPPSYVLDSMQLYEVPFLIRAIENQRHPAWEQARMTSLILANSMGAKIKQKDLLFPWECEEVEAPDMAEMRKKLNELKGRK